MYLYRAKAIPTHGEQPIRVHRHRLPGTHAFAACSCRVRLHNPNSRVMAFHRFRPADPWCHISRRFLVRLYPRRLDVRMLVMGRNRW